MTSDQCARRIAWSGGTHTFDLNHQWVRSVLEFRGIAAPGDSPAACLARFNADSYSIGDVERVLELGLIGGGMPENEVDELLNQHVRGKPVAPLAMIAFKVLAALFVGKVQADAVALA
jgi:hypothetical protein